MDRLNFTKEEKKEIKIVLKQIINEINELFLSFDLKELVVVHPHLPIGKERLIYEDWVVKINKKSIYVKNKYPSLAKVEPFSLQSLLYSGFENKYEMAAAFIKAYPDFKDEMFNVVKNYKTKKDSLMASIRDKKDSLMASIRDMHQKLSSTVEIDIPDTINVSKLELTKEDDKNIGTINFGDHTIKIITSGNIVLVDKRNKPKEKELIK